MRTCLGLFVLLLVCATAQSQEVIKGTAGLRSAEEQSSNGVSTIRFENIAWIPNLTEVSFSNECRFKITQPALVFDQDSWFSSDPAFRWSNISKITVWNDRLFFGAWIGVYGNEGEQYLAKSCQCSRDAANESLAALANEISRGHSEIAVDSRNYWSFPSLLLLMLGTFFLVVYAGGGTAHAMTDGVAEVNSEENHGLGMLAALVLALIAWLFSLSVIACLVTSAIFVPLPILAAKSKT